MSDDGIGDRGGGPPRLLAITVDRLSAWMLPAYGATWVAARGLDRLAAAGVVFDRVLAPSLDPRATREALLPFLAGSGFPASGQPVAIAECNDPGAAAAAVREGGATVVACHVATLARAWDAPVELRERYRDEEDLPAMEGREVPDLAVDARTDPDLVNVVRQAYAAEITFLDRRLEDLLVAADESPHAWTILIAGTSGMPLGLHGQAGLERVLPNCISPHGERVHLPVIVRHASGRMAGQRFPGLLAAEDIGAAAAEWLGLGEAGPRLDGRRVAAFFESGLAVPRDRLRIAGLDAAAVATEQWHLVATWPGGREAGLHVALFHKPDDFFEVNDVADRCSEETERLLAACLE